MRFEVSGALLNSFFGVMRRALLGVCFLVAAVAPASAQDNPERCKIGVYIIGLHDMDVQKKSFDSDFWLWSLCDREQRTPLKSVEFVNANRTAASLDNVVAHDGVFWSAHKIEGTFRYDWDVRNFPFDRHVLKIAMEEGIQDTRNFQYEPDQVNSGYDRRIEVAGWQINGFRLVPLEWQYNTTFGDPSLPPGAAVTYSRLQAEVMISRSSYTSFLKMASVVYVAAILALLSFLFHLNSPSSFGDRITFLAGSLFTTVINMRVSSAELGSNEGLTLIDMIHITCLLLVLAATVLTIMADRRRETGSEKGVRDFDLRNLAVCTALFVVANVVLIATAINGG